MMNLGDVHMGSPAHDAKLFQKAVEYIKAHDDCYWVSTGDLLDVALKDSKSDVYTAMPLEKEFKLLTEALAPIADKCLGIVGSNHHHRFDRSVGMSLDQLLCDKLGVPFLGITGLVNVVCDKAAYYVAMHHGFGGGRTRGAKTANLAYFGTIIPGADLYLSGHTHTYVSFPEDIPYIDRKRGLLVDYQAHFVCTAHFLKWKNSYGESKLYKPSTPGAALVTLHAHATGNRNSKRVDSALFN